MAGETESALGLTPAADDTERTGERGNGHRALRRERRGVRATVAGERLRSRPGRPGLFPRSDAADAPRPDDGVVQCASSVRCPVSLAHATFYRGTALRWRLTFL